MDTPAVESSAVSSPEETPNGSHDSGEENPPPPAKKAELERRSSRLSKQSEVEEDEEHSPTTSDQSDATVVPSTNAGVVVVHTADSSSEEEPPPCAALIVPQHSIESDKSSPTSTNPKVKLVRSQAVENDDLSPSATSEGDLGSEGEPSTSPNPTATLSVSPLKRYKLGKSSSQSSLSENGTSPALSRDSSVETQYTDSSGVDLENFIKMTLNKNRNDRVMLLKLENDMIHYIKESKNPYLKFPQMTSYHRMLVHRVAAFFGLDHNIDQSGKCVIVNKTANTRVPDFHFRDHAPEDCSPDRDQPKRLLKRDQDGSYERSPQRGLGDKKSKSFEEREEEYEKARRRIFNVDSGASSLEVAEGSQCRTSQSKDDVRWSQSSSSQGRPWSSTESSGYSTDSSGKRIAITKASSFPSQRDEKSWNRLTKADSVSSAASSLSSPQTKGQNSSLSETSSQSASSPSQGGGGGVTNNEPPFLRLGDQGQLVVWVATSMDQVPNGSIIIDPQTCQPYTNHDGSPFRWQQTHSQAPVIPHPSSVPPPPPSQMQPPTIPPPLPPARPMQQQPQQPVMRPDHPRNMDAAPADLIQPLSAMTLTPQPSECQAMTADRQPYSIPAQVPPNQQQQQPQQQQQYMQPQQIQYYSHPPTQAPPVRYMYSPSEHPNYGGYSAVMGFPQMTVQSVETYQPQQPPQQPPQQQQPYNYSPPEYPASSMPAFYSNGAAATNSPPSHMQPVFYTSAQPPRPQIMMQPLRAPRTTPPPQQQVPPPSHKPMDPRAEMMAAHRGGAIPMMRHAAQPHFRAPSPGDPRLVGPSLQILPNPPRPRNVSSNTSSQAKLKNRKSWNRSLEDPLDGNMIPCAPVPLN